MDLFKNNLVAGVGIALAASVLAPIIFPAASRIGRPLAKSVVRGGMMLYEKGREAVAVAGESVEDIMAEIRAETAAGAAAGTVHADTASPATGHDIERPYGGNGAGPASPTRPAAGAQEAVDT